MARPKKNNGKTNSLFLRLDDVDNNALNTILHEEKIKNRSEAGRLLLRMGFLKYILDKDTNE